MKKLKDMLPYVVIVLIAGVTGLILGRNRIARETKPLPPISHPEVSAGRASQPYTPHTNSPDTSTSVETPRPEPMVAKAREATPPPVVTAEAAKVSPEPAPTALAPRGPSATELHETALHSLHLVGADATATENWLHAINDPRLSARERKDLIEDLNEAGLSDPRRPTEEDLPLLAARIQLIEAAAEHALDKTNADAFAEVYKDLLNLADVALGGVTPPQ